MARRSELILSPYTYLPNGTGSSLALIKSKDQIFRYLVEDKLGRTLGMFKYKKTPETFDPVVFEIYLQTQGYAVVVLPEETHGKPKGIYVLQGQIGGELNASYRPTLAMPVSPYLQYSAQLKIGEECVVVRANEIYRGINEINSFYAGLLAEAYTTLRLQLINLRAPVIVKTDDDDTKASADEYFKALEEGDLKSFLSKNTIEDLAEGASGIDYTNRGQSHVKDTMELIQYLHAQWNIAIGLNDNYNMKREAINSTEVDSNTEPLMTWVDAQLESRKKGIEEINAMFGTEIEVELGDDWRRAYEYVIQALENAEADNEANPDEKTIEEKREEVEKPEETKEEKKDDQAD